MKPHKTLLSLSAALLLASCGNNAPASSSEAPISSEPPASSVTSESSTPASSSEAPISSESSVAPISSESEPVVPTGHPFIDHEVSIEFMSNSSYGENIDSFIKAFAELEPNVHVTNTKESASYQGVIDKVIQGFPANNYPDIVVGYPDAVVQMMDTKGKVVQLDPYVNDPNYGWSEEDLDDIIGTYLEEGRTYPREGMFSMPFAKSTEAMFYNKDVLIGLDLSTVNAKIGTITADYIEDLTWEELFDELCPAIVAYNDTLPDNEKILKDHATYSKAVFGYDSDDNFFITVAAQYGYGYTSIDEYGEGSLDFDNPEMKAILKKFNKAKNDGYLITKGTSNGGNYTNYSFTNGCALFTVGSTGGMKYQVCNDFETAVAPIPHAKGRARKVINQGPSLCLLNHDDPDRVLAAWLFTKFMTNEENSLSWSLNTGYLPIRYSVVESGDYQEAIAEGKEASVYSLEHLQAMASEYVGNNEYVGDALFASPVFKGSSEARTEVGALVTKILNLSEAECTDKAIDDAFALAIANAKKAM